MSEKIGKEVVTAPVEKESLEVTNDQGEGGSKELDEWKCLGESFEIDSDDEFPDELDLGNGWIIKNYRNPKDCLSTNVKLPGQYLKKDFKPTIVSFKNQLNFFATSSHATVNQFRNTECALSPYCSIKWTKKTLIAKVFIMEQENHILSGTEQWVCGHHQVASILGYKLQLQCKRGISTRKQASKRERSNSQEGKGENKKPISKKAKVE